MIAGSPQSGGSDYSCELSPIMVAEQAFIAAPSGAESGPPISPKQRIYFYSPDDWEEFTYEWAMQLTSEGYVDVARLGGANDRGVDIAAFLSEDGFRGEWDCYQCKHYKKALEPADAFNEILKVLHAVVDNYYSMPRRYTFVAPKGCGPSLSRMLKDPDGLKSEFEAKLGDAKWTQYASLPDHIRKKIVELAAVTSFNIFRNANIDRVIEVHQKSPKHVTRFGVPLPPRPAVPAPTENLESFEVKYVEQLMRVYAEKLNVDSASPEEIAGHGVLDDHFKRQRVAFFSAEALRSFARDSVPAGTFESLQEEIYYGVIDIEQQEFPTGMERLTEVLREAHKLSLTANALITVTRILDRSGMCHQLANEDKLVWCKSEGG